MIPRDRQKLVRDGQMVCLQGASKTSAISDEMWEPQPKGFLLYWDLPKDSKLSHEFNRANGFLVFMVFYDRNTGKYKHGIFAGDLIHLKGIPSEEWVKSGLADNAFVEGLQPGLNRKPLLGSKRTIIMAQSKGGSDTKFSVTWVGQKGLSRIDVERGPVTTTLRPYVSESYR
jgi:hypothetical protein